MFSQWKLLSPHAFLSLLVVVPTCSFAGTALADDPAEIAAEYCDKAFVKFKGEYKSPSQLPKDLSKVGLKLEKIAENKYLFYRCAFYNHWSNPAYVLTFEDGAWNRHLVADLSCTNKSIGVVNGEVHIETYDRCNDGYDYRSDCSTTLSRYSVKDDPPKLVENKVIWEQPYCKHCKLDAAKACTPKMRNLAKTAYKNGDVKKAQELLESLIAFEYYEDHNGERPLLDTWVASELLLYTVRSGGDCYKVVDENRNVEATDSKGRKSYLFNKRLCYQSWVDRPIGELRLQPHTYDVDQFVHKKIDMRRPPSWKFLEVEIAYYVTTTAGKEIVGTKSQPLKYTVIDPKLVRESRLYGIGSGEKVTAKLTVKKSEKFFGREFGRYAGETLLVHSEVLKWIFHR